MGHDGSDKLFERANQSIVGGVNSPVRAFRAVGGHPVFIDRAKGCHLYSVDGDEYVDFVGTWGPALLGHADEGVVAAVQAVAAKGLSFGAPTALEVEFAEAIKDRYPSMDLVRCVSSGTEATMSAIRAARGFTKRDYLIKFEGNYHGHADHLLVKAGSGLATFGEPDSGGVPEGIAKTTLTLPYNDLASLEKTFTERKGEIAAVICEPVVGNMGCVPPEPGFLEGLVRLCDEHGAVSIFDEVMTGCRLARGGAQERYGIRPAMTTLGKVVGGGMPLAVYGGRREIMEVISPLGSVYQAGTLSGNPLATTAGLETLKRLDQAVYDRLEQLGARLEKGLVEAIAATKIEACVQRVGSMITVFFQAGPVKSWTDSAKSDKQRFGAFHRGMLARGIYWPPAQFEAAFLSAAHDDAAIDKTVAAARETFGEIRG